VAPAWVGLVAMGMARSAEMENLAKEVARRAPMLVAAVATSNLLGRAALEDLMERVAWTAALPAAVVMLLPAMPTRAGPVARVGRVAVRGPAAAQRAVEEAAGERVGRVVVPVHPELRMAVAALVPLGEMQV